MTALRVLGNIGIGLVWGWLLGSFTCRGGTSYQTVMLLCFGTLVLGLIAVRFEDLSGLAWFSGALIFASLLHLGWRQKLTEHRLDQFTSKEKH